MKVRTIRPTRGVILSVLAVMIHLLRCNDVERNPGPDNHVDKRHELSRQFQCALQIMTEVRQQNVAVERQLTLSHNAVTQDMSFIKQRLSGVTEFVQKNSRDIELLNKKLQNQVIKNTTPNIQHHKILCTERNSILM